MPAEISLVKCKRQEHTSSADLPEGGHFDLSLGRIP